VVVGVVMLHYLSHGLVGVVALDDGALVLLWLTDEQEGQVRQVPIQIQDQGKSRAQRRQATMMMVVLVEQPIQFKDYNELNRASDM
jgi:hypothetical protein